MKSAPSLSTKILLLMVHRIFIVVLTGMNDVEVDVGRDTESWGDREGTLLGLVGEALTCLPNLTFRYKAALGEGGTISWPWPESATSMTPVAATSQNLINIYHDFSQQIFKSHCSHNSQT